MHEGTRSINELAKLAVDCAFRVHTALGPGLLESVYETCMEHELRKLGLRVERQVARRVHYDGLIMEDGYRFDLLVEGQLVIEIKSVEQVPPVVFKQVLTYLKIADLRLGLLIHFNVALIKDGIKRIINGTLP
ncbi:MAG TPA: GxxExxY protein [Fimbriimonadaceae bacterium]|nr:GxxExxY protein [Fimbriimonadaceae bacterium]